MTEQHPTTVFQRLAARFLSGSVPRYVVVGLALLLLDVVTYSVWVLGGAAVWQAQLVARTVGAATGFVAHRQITFKTQTGRWARQGVRYLWLVAINLLGSPLLVEGLYRWLANPFVAKGVAEVLLVTWTYLAMRLWVFRHEPTA
jgi:putative flippase GtrA